MHPSIFLSEKIPVFYTRQDEIKWLMKKLPVKGLCLEFGVWRGTTINCAAACHKNRNFYGFDSFDGLPENWNLGDKIVTVDEFKMSNMPNVLSNVHLIKGLFQDTLINWWNENKNDIAYLHIDSDIYSSAKFVLNVLRDGITKNTIVRFDELVDWNEFTKKDAIKYANWREHEWKAFEEFVKDTGKSFIPISRNVKWGASVVFI